MRKEKPKEKKNQKGRTNVVSKKQFITFYATSKTPQGITMVREGNLEKEEEQESHNFNSR